MGLRFQVRGLQIQAWTQRAGPPKGVGASFFRRICGLGYMGNTTHFAPSAAARSLRNYMCIFHATCMPISEPCEEFPGARSQQGPANVAPGCIVVQEVIRVT